MDCFDLCPGAAPPAQPRRLLQGRFNRTGIGNRLARRAACLFTHLLFLFLLQSFAGNQTRGRQICSPAGWPEPRGPGPRLALACVRKAMKGSTNRSELDLLTPAGEDVDLLWWLVETTAGRLFPLKTDTGCRKAVFLSAFSVRFGMFRCFSCSSRRFLPY